MKSHGMSETKIYSVWCGMRRRCNDPRRPQFKYYGARGIRVCDEWNRSFESFFTYVSKLPGFMEDGVTIDRKDGNGDYTPGNVQWSPPTVQMRNRRGNYSLNVNGKAFSSLTEACEEFGLPFTAIHQRLYTLKWPVARAFAQPVRKRAA